MNNTNTNASVSVNATDSTVGYIVPATFAEKAKALRKRVYEVSRMTDGSTNEAYARYEAGDKSQLLDAIQHGEKHLDVMAEQLKQYQSCWDEAIKLADESILDTLDIYMSIAISSIEALNDFLYDLRLLKLRQQQRKSPLDIKGWTFTK